MLDIRPMASLEVLNINTGEVVGPFFVPNAGVVRERIWEGPSHVNRGLRMSRSSWSRPVYRSVGLQPLRPS